MKRKSWCVWLRPIVEKGQRFELAITVHDTKRMHSPHKTAKAIAARLDPRWQYKILPEGRRPR